MHIVIYLHGVVLPSQSTGWTSAVLFWKDSNFSDYKDSNHCLTTRGNVGAWFNWMKSESETLVLRCDSSNKPALSHCKLNNNRSVYWADVEEEPQHVCRRGILLSGGAVRSRTTIQCHTLHHVVEVHHVVRRVHHETAKVPGEMNQPKPIRKSMSDHLGLIQGAKLLDQFMN